MGEYASKVLEESGRKERVSIRHAYSCVSVFPGDFTWCWYYGRSYRFRVIHHWGEHVFGASNAFVEGTTKELLALSTSSGSGCGHGVHQLHEASSLTYRRKTLARLRFFPECRQKDIL